MRLDLITIVVDDYDQAIEFFTAALGFFVRADDFDAAYARMAGAGVEFVTAPRAEPYGRVAVFRDIAGNRWDLLEGEPA